IYLLSLSTNFYQTKSTYYFYLLISTKLNLLISPILFYLLTFSYFSYYSTIIFLILILSSHYIIIYKHYIIVYNYAKSLFSSFLLFSFSFFNYTNYLLYFYHISLIISLL